MAFIMCRINWHDVWHFQDTGTSQFANVYTKNAYFINSNLTITPTNAHGRIKLIQWKQTINYTYVSRVCQTYKCMLLRFLRLSVYLKCWSSKTVVILNPQWTGLAGNHLLYLNWTTIDHNFTKNILWHI